MLALLPHELIQFILEALSYPFQRDLINCCLTSKVLLEIAQPLLHQTVRIWGGGTGKHRITMDSHAKLWTLQSNPRLQPMVRRITVDSFSRFFFEGGYEILPWQLLATLITTFHNADVFILSGIAMLPDVDNVVRQFQDQLCLGEPERRAPVFRLKSGSEGADTSLYPELTAAYEGCNWPASEEAALNIDQFLRSSHHSLRRLWIPLTDSTTLHNFRKLELLTLRTSFEFAPRIVKNLARVLPTLSSLRVLVLFATLDSRFSLQALPAEMCCVALPPFLHTLAFEFDIDIDALARFVEALPPATLLKRIDCYIVEGDVDYLRSYSRSRGIELRATTRNPVWTNELGISSD